QRSRREPRGARANLQPVLYDQGGRHGDGPVDLQDHRREPWRSDRRTPERWPRGQLSFLSPGGSPELTPGKEDGADRGEAPLDDAGAALDGSPPAWSSAWTRYGSPVSSSAHCARRSFVSPAHRERS